MSEVVSSRMRFMSGPEQQNGSSRRSIGFGLLSVEVDRLTDILLARLRALSLPFEMIEGDTDVLEGAVSTDTHPKEFAKDRRAAIPNLTLPVDVLQQFVVSGYTVSDVRGHSGHGSEYNGIPHKHLHTMTWLQTILGEQGSASYNTVGAKEATKRSVDIRNRAGCSPGDGLGTARFAGLAMKDNDAGLDKPIGSGADSANKYTLKPADPRAKRYATFRTNTNGYEVWRDQTGDGPEKRVRVHRLVAVAEFGFDEVADKHVHHKNGCTWDNRSGNLEVLDAADHLRHHKRIPDEELLEDIRAGAAVLGRPPRSIDIDRFGEYSSEVYRERFGTWDDVLKEAGLEE